jgi:hypothetical protein
MATNTAGSTARTLYTEQVCYLRQSFVFGATTSTAITIGTVPKGAVITDVSIAVSTAFNFGTNNLTDIGTVAASTNLASGASLATAGLIKPSLATSTGIGPFAADTAIIATPSLTGTAGTTGKATVAISYIMQNDFAPS